jgi:putative CocE/NonD family hydrolase
VNRVVIERDHEIGCGEDVVLRADVYRTDDDVPRPALLQYTAYDKDNWVSVYGIFSPVRAVEAGFAVVVVDAIGRFKSEGNEPYRPFLRDAEGAAACVDWIVGRAWSNGAVGMYGASNSGVPILQGARRHPPGLRSLAPHFTTSEFSQGWVYRGGAFQFGFNAWWTLANLAPDMLARAEADGHDVSDARAEWRSLFAEPERLFARPPATALGAVQRFTPHYTEWIEHGPGSAYWEPTSWSGRWDTFDLPALHIAGGYNVHLDGNLAVYQAVRRHAPPAVRDRQYLVIGPWTQWMPALGESCGPEARFPNALVDMAGWQLDWFAETLAGEVADRPRVRAFVTGEDGWRTFDEWPPPEGRTVELRLTSSGQANTAAGDGGLSWPGERPPDDDDRADRFVVDPSDPVPTVGGATMLPAFTSSAGPRDQRQVESRSDVLVYTSPRLRDPVDAVGPVSAVVHVATAEPSIDLTAKLVDVHPDGRAVGLCDGIVRTGEHGQPVLRRSAVTPIEIDLVAVGHRFHAGHRIRLEIGGSNFPKFDLHARRNHPDSLPATVDHAYRVEVHHDARHPSVLRLHLLTAPEPPTG